MSGDTKGRCSSSGCRLYTSSPDDDFDLPFPDSVRMRSPTLRPKSLTSVKSEPMGLSRKSAAAYAWNCAEGFAFVTWCRGIELRALPNVLAVCSDIAPP